VTTTSPSNASGALPGDPIDLAPVTRRRFIRTFAGGALGGALLYAFPQEARARYILSNEEVVPADDLPFWTVVRDQFPLKKEPLFLNNGTIGPSPFVVIDAVTAEMGEVESHARYGGWDTVRPKIAQFINAQEDEISLTHNVTEGINVVAAGLPLKRGDEVILTNHEHAGNAVPWLARARRDGIVVKMVELAGTSSEILSRINDCITSHTRVIAVPHVTCTTGQVLPAKEIARLGHSKGLWVFFDGAHTPGMMALDVKDIDCDFFASCGHKWMMGPKGTGFLYVRKELQEILEPQWAGALSDAGWDVARGTLSYRKDAHKYDFGTQNAALYVGLGAAVDFLHHIGMENITRHNKALATQLRNGLKSMGNKVEILTPEEEGGYCSVIGFRVHAMPYDKLQPFLLEKHKIVTRMVPENGVNCNRISTHIYNSADDVARVVEAIRSVA
jgi:cysteine desulfurase / selenocysteine lyase